MKAHRLELRLVELFRAQSVGILSEWGGDMLRVPALRARVRSFCFPEPVIPEAESSSEMASDRLLKPMRLRQASRVQSAGDGLSLRDRLFYALQPPVEIWLTD